MKKLICMLLVLALCLPLVACGSASEDDKGSTKSAATTATTEAAPKYPPVTIGALTIEFESAAKYSAYKNQACPVVYFNITNNSDAPVKPSQIVFLQAMVDGNSVSATSFQEDVAPELYNSLYQDIAPGETVRCMEAFSNVYVDGKAIDAVYEITVMDLYHQIPEKLVFTIDTATLDVFGPGVE